MKMMLMKFSVLSISFFFEAEDGIRGTSVTGVQTCALPICSERSLVLDARDRCWPWCPETAGSSSNQRSSRGTSRERDRKRRRVGKGCRKRRSMKKKRDKGSDAEISKTFRLLSFIMKLR